MADEEGPFFNTSPTLLMKSMYNMPYNMPLTPVYPTAYGDALETSSSQLTDPASEDENIEDDAYIASDDGSLDEGALSGGMDDDFVASEDDRGKKKRKVTKSSSRTTREGDNASFKTTPKKSPVKSSLKTRKAPPRGADRKPYTKLSADVLDGEALCWKLGRVRRRGAARGIFITNRNSMRTSGYMEELGLMTKEARKSNVITKRVSKYLKECEDWQKIPVDARSASSTERQAQPVVNKEDADERLDNYDANAFEECNEGNNRKKNMQEENIENRYNDGNIVEDEFSDKGDYKGQTPTLKAASNPKYALISKRKPVSTSNMSFRSRSAKKRKTQDHASESANKEVVEAVVDEAAQESNQPADRFNDVWLAWVEEEDLDDKEFNKYRTFSQTMQSFKVGHETFPLESIQETIKFWKTMVKDDYETWKKLSYPRRISILTACRRLFDLRDDQMTAKFSAMLDSFRKYHYVLRTEDARLENQKPVRSQYGDWHVDDISVANEFSWVQDNKDGLYDDSE